MAVTARRLPLLMNNFAQSKRFDVAGAALSDIQAGFAAGRADEDEVAATIRTALRETGHFIDPHTAVGIAVAEKEPRDPSLPMVVLSTAHAAKFPDAVEAACGERPPVAELAVRSHRPEGAHHQAPVRSDSKLKSLYRRPHGPRVKELPHER